MNRLKKLTAIMIVCIVVFTGIISFAEVDEKQVTIASFNALHLGWNNNKDIKSMAEVIKDFDIVGLEEVMNKEGVEQLVKSLNDMNAEKNWSYHISDLKVGRGTYKEYYAYVFTDEVKLLSAVGFYPDKQDIFEREPYGATFKVNEFDFTLVLFHGIYGKSKSQRVNEVSNLDLVYTYFQELDTMENDILIAGDFNLPADNLAFDLEYIDGIKNAIDSDIKTTIGTKGLASAYDNIFYSKYTDEVKGSGVVNFTRNNHSIVRKTISDHIPVYILADSTVDDDGSNKTMESTSITSTRKGNIVMGSKNNFSEEVVITNNSSEIVNISEWQIVSEKGNQTYYFPQETTLSPGASVVVLSGKRGEETEEKGKLIWTSKYIWNNNGDPGALYDTTGKLIDRIAN
ncbi:MAG: lamin tail domain-containing protein [Tissierellales bacterium]|nr:lamin tail domain-containing protein [Tissierellales bacterium]